MRLSEWLLIPWERSKIGFLLNKQSQKVSEVKGLFYGTAQFQWQPHLEGHQVKQAELWKQES